MSTFKPKYITFDCYGTMTNFQMGPSARRIFADRISPEQMEAFVEDFRVYRLDEVLGDWKPFKEVVHNSVERTCRKWKLEFREEEALEIYHSVPTWGPHPDVPEGLLKVAHEIPLVILSNADNDQIYQNVEKLGAPFAHVFTAEQARAYKPRLQAFEYMFDQLGCSPEECMHVSSSFRYDHMSASDLGYGARVLVDRNHEPNLAPNYVTHVIKDMGGLASVVGL
ncbi:haloacid dehalogenase type II [Halomonas sp. LR3S48]|uniref:haloacid dehalogenase type II n=1 Tax=Halomonadaceae TaxID=28256 RepID=UPI0021E45750|nr:haloacid dehalogenase type II [Halomonas sp. LR3S48]UYG02566.1 haloacid dehalogenase type II [Halomonas sp. LR3S48]